MNREVCILVYSDQSSASERLFQYIKELPYDFLAISGTVLLECSKSQVRESVIKMGINFVPSFYVRFFNETSAVYSGDRCYGFINAFSSAVSAVQPHPKEMDQHYQQHQQHQQHQHQQQPTEPELKPVAREQVKDLAQAMFKSREEADLAQARPPSALQVVSRPMGKNHTSL